MTCVTFRVRDIRPRLAHLNSLFPQYTFLLNLFTCSIWRAGLLAERVEEGEAHHVLAPVAAHTIEVDVAEEEVEGEVVHQRKPNPSAKKTALSSRNDSNKWN